MCICLCVIVYSYMWVEGCGCVCICVCQGQVSVLRNVPAFLRQSLALAQGSGVLEAGRPESPRGPAVITSAGLGVTDLHSGVFCFLRF